MTTPNKNELIADLANNKLQLHHAVTHLSNRVSNNEWHEALDAIAELRKVEADLEAKIKALAQQE